MKKFLIIILALVIVAGAGAAFLLSKRDAEKVSPPAAYDRELYSRFCAAMDKGDYIAMNNAYDENFTKTGVSFFDVEYDHTHGGKIYSYPFTVTYKKEDTVSGTLYFVTEDVDISAQSAGENDFFAVDKRDRNDPDVVVMDSYRANRAQLITKLCEILLSHEAEHPTRWERTLDSMVTEWQFHNAAYSMNYKIDHSKDVDLNNADENTDWVKRTFQELT